MPDKQFLNVFFKASKV